MPEHYKHGKVFGSLPGRQSKADKNTIGGGRERKGRIRRERMEAGEGNKQQEAYRRIRRGTRTNTDDD